MFGGLIPPPVPFFPGNVINASTFEQFLGLPSLIVLSLVGLLLAVTNIRVLEIFDMETERRIEAMEQQQILAAERDRITRELHDGAIQTVFTAGLLVESARKLASPESPVATRLEKAVAVLNDAIRDLRRNLGELKSAPSGEPLATALRRLAEVSSLRSLVEVSLELDLADSASLSPKHSAHFAEWAEVELRQEISSC